MSSVSRSTSRGGKAAKLEVTAPSKAQKTDLKSESPKSLDHNPKIQPTAEQMRIAQIIDTRTEDPNLKDKIIQVMDATQKSEDEVCAALHDCDNDLDKAVIMLFEGCGQSLWETSVKKKKNRQPSSTKGETSTNNRDADQEDWGQERESGNPERERSRTRGGGPPRMRGRGSLDNRGWRGRENKENERNQDDGYRRGGGRMMNGPGRSGRGGRGGGRLGPRTFQSRDKGGFPRSMDTWNNPGADDSSGGDALKMDNWDDAMPADNWDNDTSANHTRCPPQFTEKWGDDFPSPEDWDNEEYTGSLADTKVFTPSGGVGPEPTPEHPAPADTPGPDHQNLSSSVASSSSQMSQGLEMHQASSQLSQSPVPVGVGTLSAAQSEYLSQFTQAPEKSAVGLGAGSPAVTSYAPVSSASYPPPSPPSGFVTGSVTFSTSDFGLVDSFDTQIPEPTLESTGTVTTQLPAQSHPPQNPRTKTQRPRVPPPSKIPSSAVEMPNDAINNSIGYLDVQFGGLEFGSEIDTTAEQQQQPTTTKFPTLDSLPSPRAAAPSMEQQPPPMDSYPTNPTQSPASIASSVGQTQKQMTGGEVLLPTSEQHKVSQPSFSQPRGATATTGMEGLDKAEVLSYTPSSSAAPYPSSYPSQKQQSNNYSSPATYPAPVSTASTPAYQSQMGYGGSSYSASFSGASGYSGLGGSTGGYSTGYQNSYGTVTTAQQSHAKLGPALPSKESQYDTTTTSSTNNMNSATTTNSSIVTNVNSSPALGLSSTSSGTNSQTVNTTSTKVTTSTGKSGVVPNMPPGVPPMIGTPQYIMSQGGLPYFQQPTMYSYEDLQLLQQRIPHMATGYYDMGFQAPTSLATGREGGLASVAYSMSDGRFTRADNNASPVPSTMSQQNATQAHQQPLLNATALPPGYAYFYGGGMMPGSFQYGTPTIYPMPPATNAHGTTSNTQYAKPGSYGSAYGSGYDGLSQSQDYGKAGYVSGSQSQSKAGVGPGAGSTGSTAADLGATMYGKSHVALGKVNSYEKQGFHSGTPPPFNLPGNQNSQMAPSGAYAPHLFIPTMPPHQQHHSTPLMHQPLHQMEMRNPVRRSESSGSSNQRSQSATQPNKAGTKQGYSPSYWAAN